MGLIFDNPMQITYLNASEGKLINKKQNIVATGISGLITGIRTRVENYNNKETTKLQLRIMDHTTMDQNSQYVITGTLYNTDGSVSVFGRMILQRLANPANNLDAAEPVAISVWAAGESKATCATIRVLTDPTPLPWLDFRHKDDPAYCRKMAERCLAHLIERYGTFGKGIENHPEEEHGDAYEPPLQQQAPSQPTTKADRAPEPARSVLFPRERQKANAAVGPDESAWNGRGIGGDDLPF